jgi:flagellar basal body-associated protein FliL
MYVLVAAHGKLYFTIICLVVVVVVVVLVVVVIIVVVGGGGGGGGGSGGVRKKAHCSIVFVYLYTVEPWFTNLIHSWRPFVT